MNRFERKAHAEGYHWVAGVDEAGRGPLAGPVVAAAVVFPPDYENHEINDSKRLSPRKRESLYERIRTDALAVGFGLIEADVIDRINILQASLTAMRDAVLELAPPPDYLLVDGCHRIPLTTPQEAVDATVDFVRDLVHKLQVPTLSSFGVSASDTPAVVAAAKKASSMRYNPVVLSDQALEQCFREAL